MAEGKRPFLSRIFTEVRDMFSSQGAADSIGVHNQESDLADKDPAIRQAIADMDDALDAFLGKSLIEDEIFTELGKLLNSLTDALDETNLTHSARADKAVFLTRLKKELPRILKVVALAESRGKTAEIEKNIGKSLDKKLEDLAKIVNSE